MNDQMGKIAYVERIETPKGVVLVVVNNQPHKRNPISFEYYDAIEAACAQAAKGDVGAVILTGAGGFFCAGGDLTVIASRLAQDPEMRRVGIDRLHRCIRALQACPQPVIAAIEGGFAGAGVSIAMACDLLVAARDSYASVAYVRAGLSGDGGVTAHLARALPRALAYELMITGDKITAERLYQLGVVNRVVEPGQALAEATALATRLMAGPWIVQGRIKRLINAAYETTMAAQLDLEAELMSDSIAGAEAAEGIRAFFEKRAPDFSVARKK